ncbi:Major facilitator superfamily, partial [Aphelenchoides avenae]
IFVDRTRLYVEALKASIGLAVIFGVTFLQLTRHRNLHILIPLVCAIYGAFGLAAYSVGLELAAECSFPVSETTSTGLIVLGGQIQSVLYLVLMMTFSKPLEPENTEYETCSMMLGPYVNVDEKDMTSSTIVMSVTCAVLLLVLIAPFHPQYRRMEAEKGLEAVHKADTTKMNAMETADDVDAHLTDAQVVSAEL